MLEATLTGKCHRRVEFVARFDDLEIPERTTGLYDRCYALFQPDVDAITKGEEGIGHHRGAH